MSRKSRHKRSQKSSVLRRQKPRKKRGGGQASVARRFAWGLAVAGAVALAAAGYYGSQKAYETFLAWRHAPVEWRVDVRLDDKVALDPGKRRAIVTTAREELGAGTPAELEETAIRLQRQTAFADVRVLKTARNRVTLSLTPRRPVACIDADRLRLVTGDGRVYGAPKRSTCPGLLLTGFFANPETLSLREDRTVALGESQSRSLDRALRLYRDVREAGYNLNSIDFKRYRGFFAELAPDGPTVAFGQPPFEEKLEKLKNVLKNLENRKRVARRIELDYHGKAFVKFEEL